MMVYADNAATSPMSETALKVLTECARDIWGNPSSLHTPGQIAADALRQAWDRFIAQPEILVEKKTKRGMAQVDVKSQAQITGTETAENALRLTLRMPAGTSVNVNPSLLTDAFLAWLPENAPDIHTGMMHAERTAILCTDGTDFM